MSLLALVSNSLDTLLRMLVAIFRAAPSSRSHLLVVCWSKKKGQAKKPKKTELPADSKANESKVSSKRLETAHILQNYPMRGPGCELLASITIQSILSTHNCLVICIEQWGDFSPTADHGYRAYVLEAATEDSEAPAGQLLAIYHQQNHSIATNLPYIRCSQSTRRVWLQECQ